MLTPRSQADNQTSSRLFRDAKPEVRLPAASAVPLMIKVNPSPAVSGPTVTTPHLRHLQQHSATGAVHSPPPAASSHGDSKSTSRLFTSILHLLTSIDISGPCLASIVPKTVSTMKEGHVFIEDEWLQHPLPDLGSSSLSALQDTNDVCPLCEGLYTHNEPGMSTPCCGLLIHQLCNFEIFEEHGRCHGCHGDQDPATMPEPDSPSATDKYIRHFDTDPQSFSTCSLKSEQVGASSTTSAIMTLGEYVESQAASRFGTSSVATDASSASFSWLSSVADDEFDEHDSLSSEELTETIITTPYSFQAKGTSASEEESESMLSEAWDDFQPRSLNPPPDRPTAAEGIEILNGATEHLVDACRTFGMCVSEEFKGTIIERILAALEGKMD